MLATQHVPLTPVPAAQGGERQELVVFLAPGLSELVPVAEGALRHRQERDLAHGSVFRRLHGRVAVPHRDVGDLDLVEVKVGVAERAHLALP